MYDELVKRLREAEQYVPCIISREDAGQAADAIEALSKPKWIPVTERLPVGGDDSGAVCENVCLMMKLNAQKKYKQHYGANPQER